MTEKMINIKDLPLLDRPRERLLRDGAAVMSNAELIAILLGSGHKNMPVMSICRNLVSAINNSAAELGKMSVEQLSSVKGIGEIKAIILVAALELGKRSLLTTMPLPLKEDKDVESMIRPYFILDGSTQYYLVLMNHRNELLATSELLTEPEKLPQLNPIIKLSLEAGAATIMLCRNEIALTDQFLNKEKAFVIQLDAAASMLKMKMRGLLIVDKAPSD